MDIVVKTAQEITTETPQRIEELVDRFIAAKDVKLNSKLLYRRTLKQYFSWIAKKSYLLSEIARPQLLEYKEELLSSGMSSLTVGSYITSVRLFYEWAEANKYYPNVAKGVKLPKRNQEFRKLHLYPDQATALLNYYRDKALRDIAIINLLLRGGLRCIEVIRANVGDITYKKTDSGAPVRVLLVHGKGRDEKDQFIVLTDKAYKPIEEYLATRGNIDPTEPLFTSISNNSNGERLTTRSISYIAKEGLKAIGLNERRFTAHSLRHTAATTILRATGDLEQTRLFCRHTNPATTLIYTATLNEERRLQNSGEVVIDSLY
jgi:integrase/recombinase XerC/integrase/recombinase XerD